MKCFEDDLLAIGDDSCLRFRGGQGRSASRLSWNGSGKARRNPDNSSADPSFRWRTVSSCETRRPGRSFAHGFCRRISVEVLIGAQVGGLTAFEKARNFRKRVIHLQKRSGRISLCSFEKVSGDAQRVITMLRT